MILLILKSDREIGCGAGASVQNAVMISNFQQKDVR
jgi:hypothetical protein